MNNSDYKLFWVETIKQLKEENLITEQEFSMWFRNMDFLEMENSSLTVCVPSNFYRDQVKQRYLNIIESKLRELTGSLITLEFKIEKSEHLEHHKNIGLSQSSEIQSPANTPSSKKNPHHQLRQDYDFEGFIIGNNNSFAASAAQAIAKKPGGSYNPFLIYGGVGLGKTHLMQAIGNAIYSRKNEKKIVYIAAETFVNEFIQSIKTETQSQFKNKYRKVDVLLIDDIHDLQNKKETQEELFHTFNALYDSKKQLIFTCDRPPSELKNFTGRLKNRFERGLNVDLQPPNFETRYAILEKKLESIDTHIPENVLEFIAKNVTTNIRDLEASLIKLVAYADLVEKQITVEIAQQQLKNSFTDTSNITIDRIQRVVSNYFNITPADLKGKKKTKVVTFPRQIAMYIIREITDYSTTEIGLEFGGRDHTTVMHACQRIDDRQKSDPTLEPAIGSLIRTIKEQS